MKTITVLICALLPFRTSVCLAYDEWGQDDTLVEDTETFVGGQLVLSTQNINGSSAIVLTAQVIPKTGLQNGQRTKKTVNENDEGSEISSSTPTPMFVPSSTQTTTATTTRTTTTTTSASPTSQPGHDQTRGSDELVTKTTAPPSVSSMGNTPDDKSDKAATSDPTGWTTKDVLRK